MKSSKSPKSTPSVAPEAQTSAQHVYLREIDPSANDSLAKVVKYINAGMRVLDVGTGSGALGKYLKARGCVIDGLTLNPAEAELAKSHYANVWICDLDRDQLPSEVLAQRYDAVVCADVLEHLSRPLSVLTSLTRLLGEGGRIVLSIPNATHCAVVMGLLEGRFPRGEEGLLDRTHAQFYDRIGLQQLIEQAGLTLAIDDAVRRNLIDTEHRWIRAESMPRSVLNYVAGVPDSDTYQFIWVLKPAPKQGDKSTAIVENLSGSARVFPEFQVACLQDLGSGFDAKASGHALGEQRMGVQTLRFDAAIDPGCLRLRVGLADRRGIFEFFALRLVDAERRVVFQWVGDWTPVVQTNSCAWTCDLGAYGGTLVRATGDDPFVIVDVSSSLRASATWLELDVTCASVDVSEQAQREVVRMLGEQVLADRKLAQAVAQHDDKVSQLADVLRVEREQGARTEAFSMELIESLRARVQAEEAARAQSDEIAREARTQASLLEQGLAQAQQLLSLERSEAAKQAEAVKQSVDGLLARARMELTTQHDEKFAQLADVLRAERGQGVRSESLSMELIESLRARVQAEEAARAQSDEIAREARTQASLLEQGLAQAQQLLSLERSEAAKQAEAVKQSVDGLLARARMELTTQHDEKFAQLAEVLRTEREQGARTEAFSMELIESLRARVQAEEAARAQSDEIAREARTQASLLEQGLAQAQQLLDAQRSESLKDAQGFKLSMDGLLAQVAQLQKGSLDQAQALQAKLDDEREQHANALADALAHVASVHSKQLSEKQAALTDCDVELAQLRKSIALMQASASWRWTAGLRKLRALVGSSRGQ